METKVDDFVLSYLATADWVEREYGVSLEFSDVAKEVAKQDCEKFFQLVREQFTKEEAEAILSQPGNDLTHLAGHDLYLTRNGHGAGFWDKPVYNELAPDACNRLTTIARNMGPAFCYAHKKKWYFQ